MAVSLLLVTPQPGLGDVIRKMLKGTGEFDVQVTDDFAEALRVSRQRNVPLAFLDAELEDQGISIHDVGYSLRQLNPQINFIVITNAKSYLPESVNQLAPRGYVHKPVDPAQLVRLVTECIPPQLIPKPSVAPQPQNSPEQAVIAPDLPWLQDVNRAAQHLTRLTLESSAQAALITRGGELWAYAGQLSKAAAQELGQTVQRYWDREEKSDLLRFVRLASTNAEHMLYATRISPAMILAMVFDSETPFSTIRTQAGKLAISLASTPPESRNDRRRPEPEESSSDLPHLSSLLSDVPPPNPDPVIEKPVTEMPAKSKPVNVESNTSVPLGQTAADWKPLVEQPEFTAPTFSLEASPPVLLGASSEHDYEIANADLDLEDEDDLAMTRKHVPENDDPQFAETRKNTAAEHEINPDSRPRSVTEVARRIVLEPVSPALYNLSYACLLIPRFERHYLTGALADCLPEWMQDISIAFSWRLEHISVRPEYFQWIVNVPPTAAPGSIMRIVRQETSQRIFSEFSHYRKDNPSGDFWAPGYLIMGGPQPHPQKLIKDFIKNTRQRQGVSKPLR
jgi:REP element-mobilizing transposase RayT/DNA-binding NarL/FixJ family response regulator